MNAIFDHVVVLNLIDNMAIFFVAAMTKLRWLNRPFMENNLKTPLTRRDEPGAVFQLKRDARSLQRLETCGDR